MKKKIALQLIVDESLEGHGEMTKIFKEVNKLLRKRQNDYLTIKCKKYIGYYIIKVKGLYEIFSWTVNVISKKKNFDSIWFQDKIIKIKFNDGKIIKENIPFIDGIKKKEIKDVDILFTYLKSGNIEKSVENFKKSDYYSIIVEIYSSLNNLSVFKEESNVEIIKEDEEYFDVCFNKLDEICISLLTIEQEIKNSCSKPEAISSISYITSTNTIKIKIKKKRKNIKEYYNTNDIFNLKKRRIDDDLDEEEDNNENDNN